MSRHQPHTVLLVQLPIPPLGPGTIRGNVPLAAAYLKLFAHRQGLAEHYHIDLFPTALVNALGDRALVQAIIEREPWQVGFTCYLWNIERTLWIVRMLKQRRPDVRVVLGGPEITADNAWVLDTPDYDFAVIGEGEQTFAQLLHGLITADIPPGPIPGLFIPGSGPGPRYDTSRQALPRSPLADLNDLGSPYLAGILDVADEEMLLLETSRGCRYRCRFCYYWKNYDQTYYLADDTIRASLQHATERGAREVFLLDPTLNQRKDFAELLRLLAAGNPGRRFSYFAELRAEGITEETARLLREANFTEVEVGLQSIEPDAMQLMDRKNNLRAFERGVRAMLEQGIRVKVDLIVGLPGDTVASVRRGLHYVRDNGLCSDLQVFNLAVLPGTAFREDAAKLGLVHQPRPPYYVLKTPKLDRADLFGLIQEAQDVFEIEFDAQAAPVLQFDRQTAPGQLCRIDPDSLAPSILPPLDRRAQAFTLWMRSGTFDQRRHQAAALIRQLLDDNPFTTLQVVLEPLGEISSRTVAALMDACQANPTYLDRYYALQPGRHNGAKRLVIVLPAAQRLQIDPHWLEIVGAQATLVWRGLGAESGAQTDLEPYEYAWSP
jgi:radical SAM superfamily enzyme YgiQ (UPF0313 family)